MLFNDLSIQVILWYLINIKVLHTQKSCLLPINVQKDHSGHWNDMKLTKLINRNALKFNRWLLDHTFELQFNWIIKKKNLIAFVEFENSKDLMLV